MKQQIAVLVFMTAVLQAMSIASAQQPTKVPRIAWLSGARFSGSSERQDAFRQGLRELGYVVGKNIILEWRFGDENLSRRNQLAAELVRLKVDVIVTSGASDTRAAKAATADIPIVMTNDGDPVASGFIASLARPGGNITGVSTLSPEISGKRLELLKEIVPKLSHLAVFGTSASESNARELREVELAAAALGLKIQYFDVIAPKDFETAFRAAVRERSKAVLMNVSGRLMGSRRKEIVALAVKSRLPVTYHSPVYVEAGGLMSYSASFTDLARRAATFVDKILKGAKPAELPVEQPTKFEFIVNLKAAKQIGLTIPPNVLVRADRVIR